MLQDISAVICLIIGMGIGWVIRSKSISESNPEKVSQLEADLQSSREAEIVSRTNLKNLHQKFEEEKKRLEEIRKEMGN